MALDQDLVLKNYQKRETLTLGGDPEFFVVDENNSVIPSWLFLPPKSSPVKSGNRSFDEYITGCYTDGFQAEFALKSGFTCIETLAIYGKICMGTLLREAREYNAKAKISLVNTPKFPVEYLQQLEDHQVELGCAPSFNAYGKIGEFPPDPRMLPYRFAGGHMHFGSWGFWDPNRWDFQQVEQCLPFLTEENFKKTPNFAHGYHTYADKAGHRRQELSPEFKAAWFQRCVKTLDAILGVYMVGVAASFDNPVRRKYYGLAGEYRTPKHGLEYRTLSNIHWAHPATLHLAYMIARAAINLEENKLSEFWIAPPEWVQEIINNCDVKEARKCLELNQELFHHVVRVGLQGYGRRYENAMSTLAFKMGMEGIESVVKDPDNIEKNWGLDGKDLGTWGGSVTATKWEAMVQ